MGTGQSIGNGLLWALASPLAMGCYGHWPVCWQWAAAGTGQSVGIVLLQALASPLAKGCYGHWPVHLQQVTGQHWLAHQQQSSVKLILPSTTEKVTEHAGTSCPM